MSYYFVHHVIILKVQVITEIHYNREKSGWCSSLASSDMMRCYYCSLFSTQSSAGIIAAPYSMPEIDNQASMYLSTTRQVDVSAVCTVYYFYDRKLILLGSLSSTRALDWVLLWGLIINLVDRSFSTKPLSAFLDHVN